MKLVTFLSSAFLGLAILLTSVILFPLSVKAQTVCEPIEVEVAATSNLDTTAVAQSVGAYADKSECEASAQVTTPPVSTQTQTACQEIKPSACIDRKTMRFYYTCAGKREEPTKDCPDGTICGNGACRQRSDQDMEVPLQPDLPGITVSEPVVAPQVFTKGGICGGQFGSRTPACVTRNPGVLRYYCADGSNDDQTCPNNGTCVNGQCSAGQPDVNILSPNDQTVGTQSESTVTQAQVNALLAITSNIGSTASNIANSVTDSVESILQGPKPEATEFATALVNDYNQTIESTRGTCVKNDGSAAAVGDLDFRGGSCQKCTDTKGWKFYTSGQCTSDAASTRSLSSETLVTSTSFIESEAIRQQNSQYPIIQGSGCGVVATCMILRGFNAGCEEPIEQYYDNNYSQNVGGISTNGSSVQMNIDQLQQNGLRVDTEGAIKNGSSKNSFRPQYDHEVVSEYIEQNVENGNAVFAHVGFCGLNGCNGHYTTVVGIDGDKVILKDSYYGDLENNGIYVAELCGEVFVNGCVYPYGLYGVSDPGTL